MASYLSAAAALFSSTNISKNYIILSPSHPPPPVPVTPSSTSSSASASSKASSSLSSITSSITAATISPNASTSNLPALPVPAAFKAGLWHVQPGQHRTNGKRVSVWNMDKRGIEMERLSPHAKEMVVEGLKVEAQALGRLRHPCILEMVEPLEETRSELVFATEPLQSTLQQAIPTSSHSRERDEELDEIEIQKGTLQLSRGLQFLHTQAKLIHSNLTPYTVLINVSGDWKVSGLGMTIPIEGGKWEMPESMSSLPMFVQRNWDYMAPEYPISSTITPPADMYSLGCILYAVHNKGVPPFRNHGSLGTLRSNIESLERRGLGGMEAWDADLRGLLLQLITPNPPRPTPETINTHSFFNSLSISTLNFLERSNFAAKPREEKIAFMKGLTGVLPRFSRKLKERKILGTLLEEMKDPYLLPSILPNIFAISQDLSSMQFASRVLPNLKPLFAIKEPPQNMLTLLDNLALLQGKVEKDVFREHVLPLVYNALESEHAAVQERALKVVPDLCETIDYAEVQGVLFPRVALVFTKTRILSVKVNTLACFLSMVKTLDQSSLTQKLVPLLAKIRTKEPAVMLATLNVHEAMGQKVDREAVATLVLPQLWTMSMGPLLNVNQFQRFMSVIHKLSDRVEKEHSQYLRDSQRNEDRSAVIDPSGNPLPAFGGSVDFESLVQGSGASTTSTTNGMGTFADPASAPTSVPATANGSKSTSWEDDVWGSILDARTDSPQASTPAATARSSLSLPAAQPPLALAKVTPPSPFRPHGTLGSTSLAFTGATGSPVLPPPPRNNSFHHPQSSLSSSSTSNTLSPPASALSLGGIQTLGSNSLGGKQTIQPSGFKPAIAPPPANKPNYNISIPSTLSPNYGISSSAAPAPSMIQPTPSFPLRSTSSLTGPSQRTGTPPVPGMGVLSPSSTFGASPSGSGSGGMSLMTPSRSAGIQSLQPKKIGKDDLGDFDPLA